MTRGGPAVEYLWFNFPPPVALHDYRYLGANFRERERIKRQKARWTARLLRMPALQRQALLAAIAETDFSSDTRSRSAVSGEIAGSPAAEAIARKNLGQFLTYGLKSKGIFLRFDRRQLCDHQPPCAAHPRPYQTRPRQSSPEKPLRKRDAAEGLKPDSTQEIPAAAPPFPARWTGNADFAAGGPAEPFQRADTVTPFQEMGPGPS